MLYRPFLSGFPRTKINSINFWILLSPNNVSELFNWMVKVYLTISLQTLHPTDFPVQVDSCYMNPISSGFDLDFRFSLNNDSGLTALGMVDALLQWYANSSWFKCTIGVLHNKTSCPEVVQDIRDIIRQKFHVLWVQGEPLSAINCI